MTRAPAAPRWSSPAAIVRPIAAWMPSVVKKSPDTARCATATGSPSSRVTGQSDEPMAARLSNARVRTCQSLKFRYRHLRPDLAPALARNHQLLRLVERERPEDDGVGERKQRDVRAKTIPSDSVRTVASANGQAVLRWRAARRKSRPSRSIDRLRASTGFADRAGRARGRALRARARTGREACPTWRL